MSNRIRTTKRTPRVGFHGNETFSLVRTGGNGSALWKCKQTGKLHSFQIAKKIFIPKLGKKIEYLSVKACKWFWR